MAVLLKDGQLVLELLAGLQADSQEEQDVVDPRHDALSLVAVESKE